MDRDLILIGGRFLDEPLPKVKQYLYKYFPSKEQKVFARYWHDFGSYLHFVSHTGIYRSRRWLKRMSHRYVDVEEAHNKAKEEGDFETFSGIEDLRRLIEED